MNNLKNGKLFLIFCICIATVTHGCSIEKNQIQHSTVLDKLSNDTLVNFCSGSDNFECKKINEDQNKFEFYQSKNKSQILGISEFTNETFLFAIHISKNDKELSIITYGFFYVKKEQLVNSFEKSDGLIE